MSLSFHVQVLLYIKLPSDFVNAFWSDIHSRFLPRHGCNKTSDLRPFSVQAFLSSQSAASANAGDIKFGVVFRRWRPPSDNVLRCHATIFPHVIFDQDDGRPETIGRSRKVAEALHVGRLRVQSESVVGFDVTDVQRIAVGNPKVHSFHGLVMVL